MTTAAKPKTLSEWLLGWLAPSVLIGLFALLIGWGVRVEIHLAEDNVHHPTAALNSCYVKADVDTEKQRRIDEKLADIGKALDGIESLLREDARGGRR